MVYIFFRIQLGIRIFLMWHFVLHEIAGVQCFLSVSKVPTLIPCWSVIDFWKINVEKSCSTNWIFQNSSTDQQEVSNAYLNLVWNRTLVLIFFWIQKSTFLPGFFYFPSTRKIFRPTETYVVVPDELKKIHLNVVVQIIMRWEIVFNRGDIVSRWSPFEGVRPSPYTTL